MYYIRKNGISHGNPQNSFFSESVMLPDELLVEYLSTRGFCDLVLSDDIVTKITTNEDALNNYLEKYPDVEKKEENETTISDLKQENKLLKAQVQAASDRSDFLEDCIAEMATLVYNSEETT